MSYATVEQLREYLEQVPAGDDEDAALEACLARAHAIVNEVLGFTFADYGATATDKDMRGEGGEWLWPPAYEAASITGIARVSARGEDEESETAVTGYVVDEDARPYGVWRGNGWTRGAWYRVTAVWGYGAAPDSVVEVELEVAVNIWRSKDRGMFSDVIGVEGGGAVGYARALTNQQRMIIDQVRARVLGPVVA
jgi:hypothetical protein